MNPKPCYHPKWLTRNWCPCKALLPVYTLNSDGAISTWGSHNCEYSATVESSHHKSDETGDAGPPLCYDSAPSWNLIGILQPKIAHVAVLSEGGIQSHRRYHKPSLIAPRLLFCTAWHCVWIWAAAPSWKTVSNDVMVFMDGDESVVQRARCGD